MTPRKPSDGPRDEKRAPGSGLDPELESDLGAIFAAAGSVEEELADAREEAARSLATAQRWQAEFENYRKRQERDQADIRARAGQRIVTELIPVIDDLDRAIDHTAASAGVAGELEHLLRGVEMVRSRILAVFAKEGVEVIDPLGQAFDPHAHQAVSQREDVGVPEHTVVEVYQKGYRMGGIVVRTAMVVVSTGGPGE
ncbi:MAG: nucleotide exchange factor GrpE [Coriobacteriia bacterium]|nr:nucleotide exchange factor GrpE [Coriobacteriia bacterium]